VEFGKELYRSGKQLLVMFVGWIVITIGATRLIE